VIFAVGVVWNGGCGVVWDGGFGVEGVVKFGMVGVVGTVGVVWFGILSGLG